MAHEIEEIDGVAQMAYAGDVPWHGLGTKVSNDLTPIQMMDKAGLNWTVKKYNSFIEVNKKRVRTGTQALVRSMDNKVLTNVGPSWNPVQNEDAFKFFTEFVFSGDMEMHTAGSLRGGQMVWALAKVKESFDVFGGDVIESYLLFSNPHQYGKSIDVRFTPVRVVCNNTLTFSLNKKSKVSYNAGHRTVFDVEKVKEAMGIAHEKFATYKDMAKHLGSRKTNADDLIRYYSEIFPHTGSNQKLELSVENLSRNARTAWQIREKQPGGQFAEGTWWQALNSVTYVTDHIQGRSADNRLYSQWFGGNQKRKILAMNKAVEYANVS